MSVNVSLRGMFRLIRVDTLRRVHTVGVLVEWLNYHQSKVFLHWGHSYRMRVTVDYFKIKTSKVNLKLNNVQIVRKVLIDLSRTHSLV